MYVHFDKSEDSARPVLPQRDHEPVEVSGEANSHCGIVRAHISTGCRSPTVSREATLRSASVPTHSSPHRRRPALRLSSGVIQANAGQETAFLCIVLNCF